MFKLWTNNVRTPFSLVRISIATIGSVIVVWVTAAWQLPSQKKMVGYLEILPLQLEYM